MFGQQKLGVWRSGARPEIMYLEGLAPCHVSRLAPEMSREYRNNTVEVLSRSTLLWRVCIWHWQKSFPLLVLGKSLFTPFLFLLGTVYAVLNSIFISDLLLKELGLALPKCWRGRQALV